MSSSSGEEVCFSASMHLEVQVKANNIIMLKIYHTNVNNYLFKALTVVNHNIINPALTILSKLRMGTLSHLLQTADMLTEINEYRRARQYNFYELQASMSSSNKSFSPATSPTLFLTAISSSLMSLYPLMRYYLVSGVIHLNPEEVFILKWNCKSYL